MLPRYAGMDCTLQCQNKLEVLPVLSFYLVACANADQRAPAHVYWSNAGKADPMYEGGGCGESSCSD
jgi:hypothetical protein